MSISEAFEERHWSPGYVYIAGSLSSRLLKIGTTQKIHDQQKALRSKQYGRARDWVLLYYVWVDHGGKTEHDARRYLPRVVRYYEKDGRQQRGRELVRCDYSLALKALSGCLTDTQRTKAWHSSRCDEFEFDRRDAEARRLAAEARRLAAEAAAATAELTERILSNPIFLKKAEELEFSVRTGDCLKNDNIVYIGDLVQRTDDDLLRAPNFGRKSLNEVKEVLAQLGLHLGMEIPGWPPDDLEFLASFVGTPFSRKVEELELSIRSHNCLKNDNIVYIGDLVQRTEAEMLRTPNFGHKSLNEIKEVLAQLGLHFGMEIPGWSKYR